MGVLIFMAVVAVLTIAFIQVATKKPEKKYAIKTPFDDKLIELGVKEQWDVNYINRKWYWDEYDTKTFMDFIYTSFDWNASSEGFDFWYEISKK